MLNAEVVMTVIGLRVVVIPVTVLTWTVTGLRVVVIPVTVLAWTVTLLAEEVVEWVVMIEVDDVGMEVVGMILIVSVSTEVATTVRFAMLEVIIVVIVGMTIIVGAAIIPCKPNSAAGQLHLHMSHTPPAMRVPVPWTRNGIADVLFMIGDAGVTTAMLEGLILAIEVVIGETTAVPAIDAVVLLVDARPRREDCSSQQRSTCLKGTEYIPSMNRSPEL